MEDCWDDDSDARLTASCVYERLSLLLSEAVSSPSPSVSSVSIKQKEMVELSEPKSDVTTSDYITSSDFNDESTTLV